ncbi:MAG: hypothetical protein JNM27_06260 [Leptospirales bacterium]|nr:hypothetical protein [Leptospirales bacterium]
MGKMTSALAPLSNPFLICATVLWLLNDLFLKATFPGPVTGKISDFCGVLVAPALLALPLDFIFRRPALARTMGILGVLVFFLLLKASPVSNRIINQMIPMGMYDPSDLVALVMLLPFWFLHKTATDSSRRAVGFIGLALAIVASIATSPAPVHVRMVSVPAIDLTFSRNEKLFFIWYPEAIRERYEIIISREEAEVSRLVVSRKQWIERKDERLNLEYFVYFHKSDLAPGDYTYVIRAMDVPSDEEVDRKYGSRGVTYTQDSNPARMRILP